MPHDAISELIDAQLRTVPDFPTPGVRFRDITPVFAHGETFAAIIDGLLDAHPGPLDGIVGIEARGFGLAAAAAYSRGIGMVPVRKAGKLPGAVIGESYSLEYGTATLEVQPDTLPAGSRVLIVDDVLATGGTLRAAVELAERAGWVVAGIGVVIELVGLNGRAGLPGHAVTSLSRYSAAGDA